MTKRNKVSADDVVSFIRAYNESGLPADEFSILCTASAIREAIGFLKDKRISKKTDRQIWEIEIPKREEVLIIIKEKRYFNVLDLVNEGNLELSNMVSGVWEFALYKPHKSFGSDNFSNDNPNFTTGWMPCVLNHLIIFAVCHPKEQEKYPILCLGSCYTDESGVKRYPCLNVLDGKPIIRLAKLEEFYGQKVRLLEVRRRSMNGEKPV